MPEDTAFWKQRAAEDVRTIIRLRAEVKRLTAALAAAEARCARREGALREALGWVPAPEWCYWPENAEAIRRMRAALVGGPAAGREAADGG
ncbi:MAG TPA: hypothetical protein VG370_34780 [Chloroflexota bacterium]|jgi:hypothetical protein|nr:hypothetical protein [Chloroflexota bacterium]